MFVAGTTPTHTFGVPFKDEEIARVSVVYTHKKDVLVDKSFENGADEIKEGTITVKLTQEETLKFSDADYVEAQVGVVTEDGNVFRSLPIKIAVGRVLKKEVI